MMRRPEGIDRYRDLDRQRFGRRTVTRLRYRWSFDPHHSTHEAVDPGFRVYRLGPGTRCPDACDCADGAWCPRAG
jgi:hypothetical protein